MAYVYRHIRVDKNEPFYIGIGSDEFFKRAFSVKNRNNYWKNITAKTSYRIDVLFQDLTWEEACEKEKEFISIYGKKLSGGYLCNITDGGEGTLGLVFSEEVKKKMSLTRTGRKQSEAQKQKRAATLSGPGNPWYGKKFSEEYKYKLSQAKLGKKRDPEVMKKIHDSLKKSVTDGVQVYSSLKEAADKYSVHQCTITRWITKGLKNFKYV